MKNMIYGLAMISLLGICMQSQAITELAVTNQINTDYPKTFGTGSMFAKNILEADKYYWNGILKSIEQYINETKATALNAEYIQLKDSGNNILNAYFTSKQWALAPINQLQLWEKVLAPMYKAKNTIKLATDSIARKEAKYNEIKKILNLLAGKLTTTINNSTADLENRIGV